MTDYLDRLRERLAHFSVFDWTDTPLGAIFWRELVVALRQRRYAMLLGLIAVALFAAIIYNLGHSVWGTIPAAVAVTNVVGLQCTALLLVLFFVIPALSAVTLTAERHLETEDLLVMALNEPLSLIAGKLFAMLALFAFFHIALLPFSVFTYFFAGIEVHSFFQITFMLYGTALCHSAMGVAISHMTHRPRAALFWVYSALFLLYVVPSWAGGQLVLARPGVAATAITWYLSPLPLLRDLLHSIAGWLDCLQFLGLQLLATGVVLLGAWVSGYLAAPLAALSDKVGWTGADPQERPPMASLPDWENPVYLKDCHTATLTRPGWSIATLLLGMAGALTFTWWSARNLHLVPSAAQGGTFLLLIVTPFVVLERCSKEMDPIYLLMLRISRLGSEQILLGKIFAAFRCLLPLTIGMMVGSLLAFLFTTPEALTGQHPATPSSMLLIYQAVLLPLKLAVAVVVCFACVRYRSPNATDLAITLVLSTLALGGAELVRSGLFDVTDWRSLSGIHFVLLFGGQLIAAAFGTMLVFLIALTRFEAVFDEGSDIFGARYLD